MGERAERLLQSPGHEMTRLSEGRNKVERGDDTGSNNGWDTRNEKAKSLMMPGDFLTNWSHPPSEMGKMRVKAALGSRR